MREPRIQTDPTTGRPILMAPGRRKRPLLTAPGAESEGCPFCPGNESETPPEVDAVRAGGTAPDHPGWRVRAFPNLYPAAACHEVIAEGDAHTEQPADLDAEVWRDALRLHRRRIAAAEATAGVRCAFWFKNVGRHAGASIAHNHSQLLGLPMLPPRLELELAMSREQECVQCIELAAAEREGRLVVRGSDHAVFCPRNPKLPFETWLAPVRHDHDYLGGGADADLAAVLSDLFGAVAGAFRRPPFNIYLHRVPGEDFHWHYELQPRTGILAGLEVGGDMYINSVPPDDAARRLRDALA